MAQRLLGHSNVTITLNVYTYVNETKQLKELEKFGNVGTEFAKQFE